MLFKKEILLFYSLIVASAGVIIAADQPGQAIPDKPTKCCKAPKKESSRKAVPHLFYMTEGLLRLNA